MATLIEEMATILLADFDAETRFELRAARGRGRGRIAEGLALPGLPRILWQSRHRYALRFQGHDLT